MLSLGLTKNGALAAEAVVFFDRTLATGFERRRKRAGQLASKMRFCSIQLVTVRKPRARRPPISQAAQQRRPAEPTPGQWAIRRRTFGRPST